jgi:predicted cupin superfamily sugar epimerase
MISLTADDIVRVLDLKPHPEGGFFRETFRDPLKVQGARAASTAIYFLLAEGQKSRWHRIDASEVWHWYAGAALELDVSDGGTVHSKLRLGTDFLKNERPQVVVPARHWQRALSLGPWTLAGCTVAPGFEFCTFELADAAFKPTD